MSGWQPIETAPIDRDLLFWGTGNKIDLGRLWRGKPTVEWMHGFGIAQYWHELPEEPK